MFVCSTYSVHGESCEKRVEGQSQMKPVFFMANPDVVFNPSQVDYGHSVVSWSAVLGCLLVACFLI